MSISDTLVVIIKAFAVFSVLLLSVPFACKDPAVSKLYLRPV